MKTQASVEVGLSHFTSSAGVIFSSRRLSRFSMANMRLFSSFIYHAKPKRDHQEGLSSCSSNGILFLLWDHHCWYVITYVLLQCDTLCDWLCLSYRLGLSQVLLGRSSAVFAAVGGLLIHGGKSWVVILVGGVDILLTSH